MKRILHIAAIVAMAAAAGLADDNVASKPGGPRAGNPKNGVVRGLPKVGPPLTNPANPVAQLYRLSPEQRERILEKWPLPIQERARKNLAWFDGLSDEGKTIVLSELGRFEGMPPERKRAWLLAWRALGGLPPERRPALNQVLRRLRAAPESRRALFLNSPQFRNQFSPEEQRIILDLCEIMQTPQ